jgi:hypothetical protein
MLLIICGVELAVGLFAGQPKVLPTGRPATRLAAGGAHPELFTCAQVRRRVTLTSGAADGGK